MRSLARQAPKESPSTPPAAAWIVAVTVAAGVFAGCLESPRDVDHVPSGDSAPEYRVFDPPAPPADPNWTSQPRLEQSGSWTFTSTPGNISGLPGEIARFQVRVSGPADGVATFAPASWVRFPDDHDKTFIEVHDGDVVDLEVVIGPRESAAIVMHYEDPETGDRVRDAISGPRAGLAPFELLAATGVERLENGERTPFGLSADVRDKRIVATYSLGYSENRDCGETVGFVGNFVILQAARERVLVGFPTYGSTDACRVGPNVEPQNSRISVTTDELPPGSYVIQFYTHGSGMIELPGWHFHTTRLFVR